MSFTKEALTKLTPRQDQTLREFGVLIARYSREFKEGHETAYDYREEYRNKLNGYLRALEESDFITPSDFRALLLYFLNLKEVI